MRPVFSYVPGQLQLTGSPLLDVLTIRYWRLFFAFAALQILRGGLARVQQVPGGQPGGERAQPDVAGPEEPGEEAFPSCHWLGWTWGVLL